MAVRPVLIRRPPSAVWAVLADGTRYAEWVVGTAGSQPVEGTWPEVGAALRYTVKVGPATLHGRTVVRACEPVGVLELEAVSRLVGTARIGIDLRPWGEENTLVTIDEHPLTGPGGRLHSMLSEALLQIRNRRMVRRLAQVVEADSAPPPGGR
ncbi:SRPBCC family protein [Streptomyces sp. MP131-18]|uniref:SRPBCC family protein n=1 Tax=Streptomyces sp. MP131-18 TaxID=1857892 RepID=UPI00097BFB12|nr:SRPBCC family protein [Streptomyces sp. MP131-18]ONK10173.1 Polyketide cyclase / dehydrase and lipid transport [Streptomyces sp. MP131-18]